MALSVGLALKQLCKVILNTVIVWHDVTLHRTTEDERPS